MIALNQGNQNPQNDMIAGFLSPQPTKVTQSSNHSPQRARDFDSTIKFNSSTGEEY